jgi:nicotinamidase-related amidase
VADNSTDLPTDVLQRYKQIILYKRCLDPFEEPRIDRLLSELRADEFILIGASTEGAVKATALGLLQRRKRVRIVVDASGLHNKKDAKLALRKIQKACRRYSSQASRNMQLRQLSEEDEEAVCSDRCRILKFVSRKARAGEKRALSSVRLTNP